MDDLLAQTDLRLHSVLERGLEQSFISVPRVDPGASGSVADVLRAGIAAQLAGLDQWVDPESGRAFYDVIPFSADRLTDLLGNAVAAALRRYAAGRDLAALVHGLDSAEMLDWLGRISSRPSARVEGSPAPFRCTLPIDNSFFIGRDGEFERLLGALAEGTGAGGVAGIHGVDGMGGVGKTAFAVHAAHVLADRFPEGQFFLSLHAHTSGTATVDPADGLATLLVADGVDAERVPASLEARAGLWRDRTAGRRMLLVLDDAASSGHVRLLLPSSPIALVLITSRRRLIGLEGLIPLSLAVLPAIEAAVLLARTARRSDVDPEDPTVARLVAQCGHLPLAIRLAGARLAHHRAWSVGRHDRRIVRGRWPAAHAA